MLIRLPRSAVALGAAFLALSAVTGVARQAPADDAKLKKLDELLKQKNQQQQSQQNQKQDQQQQDQQNQPKDQDKKPNKKDQPKPDQPKDKPEQKKSQPQKADTKEPKPDEQCKDGQMTPQEAKQLLDAQKNDEQMMPVNRKDKPPDPRKVVKDW